MLFITLRYILTTKSPPQWQEYGTKRCAKLVRGSPRGYLGLHLLLHGVEVHVLTPLRAILDPYEHLACMRAFSTCRCILYEA